MTSVSALRMERVTEFYFHILLFRHHRKSYLAIKFNIIIVRYRREDIFIHSPSMPRHYGGWHKMQDRGGRK